MSYLRFLENQYLNDDFADVSFLISDDVKTERIPAHKVILAAGSSTLKERFINCIDLKKIEIVNASSAEFKEFLFAFYSQFPEKYFTVSNAPKVLMLATTFHFDHCTVAAERFLMGNLSIIDMCFGYSLAIEFNLAELKAFCLKKINENKHDALMSSGFYGCNPDILYDILNNITVNQRDEINIIFNACLSWAEKKCILRSMDSSDMKARRNMLGKCFEQIYSIAAKDGEFLRHAMAHYKGLFDDYEEKKDLSSTFVCNPDINHNETAEIFEFARFSETILSPQTCHAKAPLFIEFQSTKQIKLNGIAFATLSGTPKGKITISVRSNDGETILVEQQIIPQVKREPKNFIKIENLILEAYKDYVIKAEFLKDAVYRSSRRIAHVFQADGLMVSFRTNSQHRDIFSHFFFSECV